MSLYILTFKDTCSLAPNYVTCLQGPLVYGHHGRPVDLLSLQSVGVTVRNAVLLLQAGHGRLYQLVSRNLEVWERHAVFEFSLQSDTQGQQVVCQARKSSINTGPTGQQMFRLQC